MRHFIFLVACICQLVMIVGCSAPEAASLAFVCEGKDAGKTMTLSVVYEGAESGTLKGKTSFGDLDLTATRTEADQTYERETRKVTRVSASGPANILMPDAKALDACIAAEKTADDTDGEMAILSCLLKVPDGAAPVAADVFLMFAIDPLVFQDSAVEVTRRYKDPSAALGKPVSLNALPPLGCKSTPKD